jgi:uncharacterized protein with GYD domain
MSHYLLQVSYTPEAWASMLANPHDRLEVVRPFVENLGGKLLHGWWAFGDYDVVAIVEMPTNVEAAAFFVAGSAGGAVKAFKTTPLLTMAEGIEAMRKAAKSQYKAPAHHASA